MKKVIYLTTNADLIPRLELEIKALLENDFVVKVICWDRRGTHSKEEEVNGINFLRIQRKSRVKDSTQNATQSFNTIWGVPGQRGIRQLGKLPLLYVKVFMALLREDIDIIHCCHPALLPLALFIGKIKESKIVYEVSEFYLMQIFKGYPFLLSSLGKIAMWCENFGVRKVNGVVCVPSRDNVIYRKYSKNNRNVQVTFNVPKLQENIDEMLYNKLINQHKDRKVIVYAGALSKDKGIIGAISAINVVCKRHPEVKLILIGSCMGDDTDIIMQHIQENGLEDHIDIIQYQSYHNLNTFYRIANIGLMFIDKEYGAKLTVGNSRKIIDYMKASIPIIGTSYKESALIIKENNCGILVNIWNKDDLAKAITYLLENPIKAEEMGRMGRLAFEEKYNWDVEKLKFLKVYNNLYVLSEAKK